MGADRNCEPLTAGDFHLPRAARRGYVRAFLEIVFFYITFMLLLLGSAAWQIGSGRFSTDYAPLFAAIGKGPGIAVTALFLGYCAFLLFIGVLGYSRGLSPLAWRILLEPNTLTWVDWMGRHNRVQFDAITKVERDEDSFVVRYIAGSRRRFFLVPPELGKFRELAEAIGNL